MKFVGVISGGKDSILAIHLAVDQGHELVALANLFPADISAELDSYMYQCAGAEIIEAIGQAFEVAKTNDWKTDCHTFKLIPTNSRR